MSVENEASSLEPTNSPEHRKRLSNIVQDLPQENLDEPVDEDAIRNILYERYADRPKQRYVFRIVIFVAILALVLVIYFSDQQRNSLNSWLRPSPPPPLIKLIDVQNGVALFIEEYAQYRSILIQSTQNDNWILLSKNDYTVSIPSLSPNGEKVAYTSNKGEEIIAVAFVSGEPQVSLNRSKIRIQGEAKNIKQLEICGWTKLEWSPNSERLGLWLCSEQESASFIGIVSAIQPTMTLSIQTQTIGESTMPRTLAWLTNNEIIVSIPPFAGNSMTEIRNVVLP